MEPEPQLRLFADALLEARGVRGRQAQYGVGSLAVPGIERRLDDKFVPAIRPPAIEPHDDRRAGAQRELGRSGRRAGRNSEEWHEHTRPARVLVREHRNPPIRAQRLEHSANSGPARNLPDARTLAHPGECRVRARIAERLHHEVHPVESAKPGSEELEVSEMAGEQDCAAPAGTGALEVFQPLHVRHDLAFGRADQFRESRILHEHAPEFAIVRGEDGAAFGNTLIREGAFKVFQCHASTHTESADKFAQTCAHPQARGPGGGSGAGQQRLQQRAFDAMGPLHESRPVALTQRCPGRDSAAPAHCR